jgi:phosphate starvation-inducible protein PhoH
MSKSWRDYDTTFYDFQQLVTKEQEDYLDSMEKNLLTICNSVSGSGKTTLAVAFAHYHSMNLLYLFAPVEENTLGYRPGGTQAKESSYYGPLKDALLDIGEDPSRCIKICDDEDLSAGWDSMKKAKNGTAWIEAKSHVFLRGTNIGKLTDFTEKKKTCVIIDEAQNWTGLQLKKALTRIHDDATVILIGHTGQIDLPNKNASGFERVIEVFKNKEYAHVCNLTKNFRGKLSMDAEQI